MIWHLLPLSSWRSSGSGVHLAGTADAHPFVHASPDEEATLAVANTLYRDIREPMVALALDTGQIAAPVRFEPPDPRPPAGTGADVMFPHIYGPVETAAVTEVRYARRDTSGRYISLDARPGTAERLDLVPHPEGGWFRETWAAAPRFEPPGYTGTRAAATAIYFLLPPGARSQWHTVASDEMWLWHNGGPLTLLLGGDGPGPENDPQAITLGPDLTGGQHPQFLVPAGTWQSAFPAGAAEVLVSCVVAPGFDFADFTALPG